MFDTHGPKVLFFGRSSRSFAPMPPFFGWHKADALAQVLPANAVGGIVWAGIYTLIAHFAGNALQRASAPSIS